VTAMRLCSWLWTIFVIVWLIAALRTKRAQTRASLGFRLLYGVPVVIAFYLMFGDTRPVSWLDARLYSRTLPIGVSGVAVTALGIGLAIWARFYIGQNWSSAVTVKIDHQLIRTGPYAWVRHPIYSGILLAMLGTAIVRREPRGFLALALLWFAFRLKSRMEERFMMSTFGSEYENYRHSTGGLIPRLHL
jgi:protein-S-isoprenylcysteine O-methyltransferase Ste14